MDNQGYQIFPTSEAQPFQPDLYGLLNKDANPIKNLYIQAMLQNYPGALDVYNRFGLLETVLLENEAAAEKETASGNLVVTTSHGREKRKHKAPEHMITVALGSQALGMLLTETTELTPYDVLKLEMAALIHDAGKELEVKLVNAALVDLVSDSDYMDVLYAANIWVLPSDGYACEYLVDQARSQLQHYIPKGIRAQVAYDLAGDINELRLKARRVTPETLGLQRMVGHASCPEIEYIVDNYDTLSYYEKRAALNMLVLHYLDDIVTGLYTIDSSITVDASGMRLNALDRRIIQNQRNPKYSDYNEAWRKDQRNKTGEAAFEMQRRVGHKVEGLLARLLNIEDPLTLPGVIEAKIGLNIEDYLKELKEASDTL